VSVADLLTGALAEEIAASHVAVVAATGPASVVAALAARRLGAPRLAIAAGFTVLDAEPVPALTLGEAGLLAGGPAPREWPGDLFRLLAHGRVGVAVTPAQLDAAGRTNLSGIGPPARPVVALPGSRGLPDHNASPSAVWYLLSAHSPRTLVERVDVVSGPAPDAASGVRRLLSPAGGFILRAGRWHAEWLAPGGADLVAAAPGLGVRLGRVRERAGSAPATLDALRAVDPHGVREAEFAARDEAARLWAAAAARERVTA
jgi:glutaconate CoA-transferase subunit B